MFDVPFSHIALRIHFLFKGERNLRQLQDLSQAVSFGTCPSLPAGRNPNTGTDGWTLAMGPNDDWSSEATTIPFGFDLFGTLYNSLFINNNGNLSFGSSYGTYTPVGFPSDDYKVIHVLLIRRLHFSLPPTTSHAHYFSLLP